MDLKQYDGRIVTITAPDGRVFTGTAGLSPADHCLHEYGREEECLRIGERLFFRGDIAGITELSGMKVLRATETWQQAGAYYVRIQAMAKKHRIQLYREFDEHDTPDTRYIVVTDDDFPIATARMYPLEDGGMMIGRVVVLPEYRHRGIGSMVVRECEAWAEDLFFRKMVLESRDNKVAFYQQMDYEICGEPVDGDTFRTVRMEKIL